MKPGWVIRKAVAPPTTVEALADFFDRLDRVVPSRLGAGQSIGRAFGPERWARELEGDLIDRPRMARAIVDRIATRVAAVTTIDEWRAALSDLRGRTLDLAELVEGQPVQASPHIVYRLYSANGALLYVGITDRGPRRWVEHARTKPWFVHVSRFDIVRCPSRAAAEDLERSAIREERPRYNVVHNHGGAPRYAPA